MESAEPRSWRRAGQHGEVALSRRSDGIFELRVNGVFVMDDRETTSERQLAEHALAAVARPRRVLVGGLGLGFTARSVLADPRVEELVVVEIEPAVCEWLREDVVPGGAKLMADPRLRVVQADIAATLAAAAPGAYDLILLDVDNGPAHLVHSTNQELYSLGSLSLAGAALSDGGRLTIWSAAHSPELAAALAATFGDSEAIEVPVPGHGRVGSYWLHSATRRSESTPRRSSEEGSLRPMVDTNNESASPDDDYRIEHDSMGEVKVPRDALWRAQTQRAVENFPISGTTLEHRQIQALALVKAAAAAVNTELGVITAEQGTAIRDAAAVIASGDVDDHFPLDVFQTGSGTSSNMNTNEVIASLAKRAGTDIHPNDHVNASQSSNDVFPTSIHVAATLAVVEDLMPSLDVLATSLEAKADEFALLVKSGRTHLMDATPVMLGQEFGGYAATVRYGVERLEAVLPRVRELPLGGTAVGTGINTPIGFADGAIKALSTATGQPFTEARNHFEAQGTRDSLVELSGVLRTIAVGLTKVCNDLRWMSSGPTTGLAEIHLPDLQPGSSIMPGKVNPVLPEATLQVCAQVIGNDGTVTVAGLSGNFELNVMLPVIARNVLESTRLLSTSSVLLAQRCVDGITADVERMKRYAASSPSVVTPLNKYIGYENAAKVAKKALAEGATIRETVIGMGFVERGEVTEAQLDAALDLESMTHP